MKSTQNQIITEELEKLHRAFSYKMTLLKVKEKNLLAEYKTAIENKRIDQIRKSLKSNAQ